MSARSEDVGIVTFERGLHSESARAGEMLVKKGVLAGLFGAVITQILGGSVTYLSFEASQALGLSTFIVHHVEMPGK